MNIGFYIKWDKHSINSSANVIGDELYAESLCKSINKLFKSIRAELYAPNYLPENKLDVIIYMNDSPPNEKLSKFHYLYLQNGYEDNIDQIVSSSLALEYDGYIFFSETIKNIFDEKVQNIKKSLFLPFGVDLEFFYPREKVDLFKLFPNFLKKIKKSHISTIF